ncbi:hypothetical protein HOA59_00845 [archaeon]|jgi:hypothetical protein|nr:hypothetical protein [archaeon]MBT6823967.1 hypothetical protein [archaeon]MBT7107197.1 hypothetical protein [archaeon]MBT7297733.1 hypothetical protein [archaeon]
MFWKKKRRLEDVLQEIANELAPEYEGELIVSEFKWGSHIWEKGAREINQTIDFQPRVEGYEKKLISVYETYSLWEKKDLHIYLRDEFVVEVAMKYLNKYISEKNLKEVEIKKEY